MASKTLSSMEVEQQELQTMSFVTRAKQITGISIATVTLLVTFVVNALAGIGDSKFGFANSTGNVSDHYYTQVTPAGYTFSIWGVIYTWQCLWIIHGWVLVIQKSTNAISWITYLFYTGSSLCNIIWSYLFNNYCPQVSMAFIFLLALFLYICVGIEAYNASQLKEKQVINSSATWVLVVNGLAVYATWVTVANLLNFGIILQYYGGLSAVNTGTLCLIMLAIELIVYFILENTVLDRFARYVFIVYPVIIWALAGILSAHWEQEDSNRNPIITLVLLVVTCIIFITRILLVTAFTFFRKQSYKQLV